MKKVRVISTAAMLALLSVGSMTFTSCTKDDDCALGYEGSNCDMEIREEMIGIYDAVDTRTTNPVTKTYVPIITKNATVTVVNIQEFGDFFEGASELVTSNVTKAGDVISFTIPSQKPDGENTVSGDGNYNVKTKKLNINYGLSNGTDINNYTGTWTKR